MTQTFGSSSTTGNELMEYLRYTILLFATAIAGCGNGMSKSDIQSAQSASEKAAELEKTGAYQEALPLIDSAITMGGLNPDQLAEAYLLRARCYCVAGKLTEAEQDLGIAEQGSPNPASWHFSRAILLSKQGKAAESKAEFAKATRIDPKLKMPL